jgi:hypothetical protein
MGQDFGPSGIPSMPAKVNRDKKIRKPGSYESRDDFDRMKADSYIPCFLLS